ncbi:MAG: transposase [Candidatus Bathyarchaeota archaeon]|nr:transposase [Candidatus Termiticorpusculum sp.]MCL1970474.1 transposase [Candidatus Termiticorpusculum sp.]
MSMTKKNCGIDAHNDLLVATILDPQTQHKQTHRFTNSITDIEQIKNWLTEHQCNKAVMESTGIYWVPLYTTLGSVRK